jgi:hypothetical protein
METLVALGLVIGLVLAINMHFLKNLFSTGSKMS